MFENLQEIKKRYNELDQMLGDPAIISDREKWQKLVKEHSSYTTVVEMYDEFLKLTSDLEGAEDIIANESDEELRDMAKEERAMLRVAIEELTEKINFELLPKDPNDDKNVIVEIRAGAGGEEASLFAYELMRMYTMYAEKMRWKVQFIENNETELGGVKEVVFMISGQGAYSRLKYESGVHRVQRVPATESQGRLHTSTVTVAVLPEVEEVEIEILEKDLKVDTYRSGGAGGQHVNKTESAIRITHLPTGIVVTCEDERSQIKNREKAMKVLKARLYDHFEQIANKEYADNRKSQVGTGDRSERIRTYNFPQGRVSDHRIGFTLYSIGNFMNGDLEEMINALITFDRNAKLEQAYGQGNK